MSSGGKKGDSPQAKRPAPARPGPSSAVRIAASMVLVLHVFVLFFYPLANSRTSETVLGIAQSPWLRWYADPLYLNHGHGFFGPDPGPSFIVEYQVQDAAGETIAEGKFPDSERIWPRLRYHRYKMLADQLETPHPDPVLVQQRKEYMLARYAQQLIRQHDGESATVTQVMHNIVPHHEWLGDQEQGIKPKPLDDKSLYRQLVSVRQTKVDVETADTHLLGPAESTPEPQVLPEAIPGGAIQ